MAAFGWIVVPVCTLLAGLSTALVVPVLIGGAERVIRTTQIRAQVAKLDSSTKTDFLRLLVCDFCRNGVSLFRPLAGVLLKSQLVRRKISTVTTTLSGQIAGVSPQALCEFLIAVSLLVGLMVYLVFGQLALALISMLAPFWICAVKAERWQTQQQQLLREQLPDALRALGMCFSAGFSLQQALEQTAAEIDNPLKAELSLTTHDMQTGCSVLEALAKLEQRTDLPDLQFVSVAMEIQHSTGGSLREILDSAADSINSAFELSRSMQVQTAQAKMSARVVSLMPLLLMAVLSVAMEGYLATFFSSAAGFMLLITALGMELVGIMAIRKILGLNLE